jgi:hypothetical protein
MEIRFFIAAGLILSISGTSFSQSFIQPNFGLKSHETLDIKKIDATVKSTSVYLSVVNRITGGTFCADKNIFIIYPDGTRSKLISSSGIPVCPDSYKFKTIGEKLDFTLTFPPLKQGTEWIDLIEDCSENCFSFYGITLNVALNRRIDDAFYLAENDESAKALISFIDIVEETDFRNIGIEGLLYVNIIKLAKESGNTAKAEEWFRKFKSSGAPRFEKYIKYLNDQGIKY